MCLHLQVWVLGEKIWGNVEQSRAQVLSPPSALPCIVALSAVGCPFPDFCETHFRRLGRNQTLPHPASRGIHEAHPRCSPGDIALASKNASLSFVPPDWGDLGFLLLSVCGWPHHPWWLPSPPLLLSDQFSVLKPLGFKYWSRFCFVVRPGRIPPSTSRSLGVHCQLLRICYHLFFSFFGLSFWSLKVLPQCVFYPGWMCLHCRHLGIGI